MKVLTAICVCLLATCLFSGCASAPSYSYQGYPIGATTMPFQQAWAVCEPQAGIVATQARNSSLTAGQQTCQPGPNYQACQASVGFANLGNSISAQDTGARTYDASLSSCLASYGWGTSKVCSANCP